MTEGGKEMATTEAETKIEGPEAPGASLIKREELPPSLSEIGLAIGTYPSGMQIVAGFGTQAVRAKYNVLTPVESFQQDDPNWRASIRVVKLNPAKDGEHFYQQAGGKLAPRKQGLELLADAAGLVMASPVLIGRERVEIGGVTAETFTHVATVKVRKSDGTLRTLEASRTYEPFAEYEEIKTSVGSGKYAKKPGTPEYDAEVRKRWLNEIKFAKAKNESKAILRAIRSALQIPHTFSEAEAKKPFVVVGWNLAPQDSAAVHAAIASLYGADASAFSDTHHEAISAWSDEPPIELEEGEIHEPEDDSSEEGSGQQAGGAEASAPPGGTAPSVPGSEDAAAAAAAETSDAPDEAAEQEPEADVPSSASAPTSEPVIEGVEPVQVDADPLALTEEDQAALPKALEAKIPMGSNQGRSVGWLLEQGEKANEWLTYALNQAWPQDPGFHDAVALACKAHRPELYAAWKGQS